MSDFSLFPDDPKADTRPTMHEPDHVLNAIALGDRDALEAWMEESGDVSGALRTIRPKAETALCPNAIQGETFQIRLAIWPFLVMFDRPSQIQACFDMGPGIEPKGRRIADVWPKMIAGAGTYVLPYRLGYHAHSLYGICPDEVYGLVRQTAKLLGNGGSKVPAGFGNDRKLPPPYLVGGPNCAPVFLMAAILSSPDSAPPQWVRDSNASLLASQLLAAKLGLASATPRVRPLMPSYFYDGLEGLLKEDLLYAVDHTRDPRNQSQVSIEFDIDPGAPRVLARRSTYADTVGHQHIQNLAFNTTWLDPARLQDMLKTASSLNQRPLSWGPYRGIDPNSLN